MQGKASTTEDDISGKVIKKVREVISAPLAEIINASLKTGVVPKALKSARICPIFKSGDNEMYTNYRPISLLPAISKILEKIVEKQLRDYLDKNRILYKRQYGFRKKCKHNLHS